MGTTITTADGVTVREGDRVYDYYNMRPGTIGPPSGSDGWFYHLPDAGGRELLNGERICTLRHAERMGWPR